MKPKVIVISLCALTAFIVLIALTQRHRHQPTRLATGVAQTFEVRGEVRSVDASAKTVRITHEAISDYMPAMTMPFQVKNEALLKGVAAGDNVQFQLVVTDDDAWIARLEKIADASVTVSSETDPSSMTSEDREAERVHLGELVPDFELVDQEGRPIRLSQFRGRAVLLTFIYTRCPLPNYCPLMSKHFADLQKRLTRAFPDQFQLLSVTLDPEFDTPAVLKEYAARYEANAADWTFATGDLGQIETVARLMGLTYVWENGLISHDLRTALIGPDGRLVQLWKSNVWTPYEVERFVRETLTEASDASRR